jgi:hypothetical protein
MFAHQVDQFHRLDGAGRLEWLALPGIGRQAARGRQAVEDRRLRDAGPGDMAGGRDGFERLDHRRLARQGPQRLSGMSGAVQRVAQEPLQHRLRPDFEENPRPGCNDGVDGIAEQHGLADIAPPVSGIELACADRPAGDRGEHRHGRCGAAQSGECGQQRRADRLHGGAVEGVIEVQRGELQAARRRFVLQLGEGRLRAREGDRGDAVDRGDGDVEPADER